MLAIKDSEIAFNSSDVAAIYMPSESDCGAVILTGNYVHDNSTTGPASALLIDTSSALIANNRFVGNSAPAGACIALLGNAGDPRWLFFGNLVANNTGGGVLDDTSGLVGDPESLTTNLRIVNSTITGNSDYGLKTDELKIGGGATIANSIIARNVAGQMAATDIIGQPGTTVRSLIGSLPTLQGDGSFQLISGSAAIDQGDNASVPVAADYIAAIQGAKFKAFLGLDPDVATTLAHDAAGHARIIDGDGNGVSTVDIGYSEFDPMLDGGATRDAGAADSSLDGGVGSVDASVGSADGGVGSADAGVGSADGGVGSADAGGADSGSSGHVGDSSVAAGDASADQAATSGSGCGGCRVAERAPGPLPLVGFVALGTCLLRRRRRSERSPLHRPTPRLN